MKREIKAVQVQLCWNQGKNGEGTHREKERKWQNAVESNYLLLKKKGNRKNNLF